MAAMSMAALNRRREAYQRFLRREDARIVRSCPDSFRGIDEMRKAWPVGEGYHNEGDTYYGRVVTTFGNLVPKLEAGSRVLDWGCSRALTTIELANIHAGCEVVGLEVRKYMDALIRYTIERTSGNGLYLLNHVPPELAGKVGGIKPRMELPERFVIADGFNAPFPDGSFNAVYCMNNLYYVLNYLNDHKKFERFHQVIRLVKPGGRLLLSGGATIDGLDDVFAMVMRKEEGRMILEHVVHRPDSDWGAADAEVKTIQVMEACGRAFSSLE